MNKLSETWLTDNLIDFEYKKYILLDYLQNANQQFDEHKLFPQFSDLMTHYDNLIKIKDNKDYLFEKFPKRVEGIDIENMLVVYQRLIKDDELMCQISDIIQYSLPQLNKSIDNGKQLYAYAEDNVSFDQVGTIPIYQNEGYVLLTDKSDKRLSVYRYTLSRIIHHKQQMNMIRTQFLFDEIKSISNTIHKVKMKLIKTCKDLPNPATFLITGKHRLPLNETLLPMTKKLLLKHVQIV